MIKQMEMFFIEDEGDVAEIVNYLSPGLRGFMGSLDMAEPLIAEYQRRYPARADLLFDAFKTISPTDGMWDAHPALVKHHMCELLQRVADGEDVRPATYAEMCIGFTMSMYIGPLNLRWQAAYHDIFDDVFPGVFESWQAEGRHVRVPEPYAGSSREIIAEMRDALAHQDRYVPGSVPRV